VRTSDHPDVGATLQQLLDAATARITRLEPHDAFAAAQAGALLIDIRSEPARERDGIVPGSLHIPRTVLEWRLAADSQWRSPHVSDPNQQVILICDHGCSSILAAATLVDLGFADAGDVIGGFAGWRNARLPISAARDPVHEPSEVAGMRRPNP